jgi:predicted DNA-binding transcriptional regulator AlpA
MRLIERLRQLVESAPPDATVPVRWIGELLDQDEVTIESIRKNGSDPVMPDLSVDDIMTATSRERSTVIGWIHDGDFPGAYKLNGREWRIPRADWTAFLDRERQGRPAEPAPSGGQAVDLGRWRKQFAGERAGT